MKTSISHFTNLADISTSNVVIFLNKDLSYINSEYCPISSEIEANTHNIISKYIQNNKVEMSYGNMHTIFTGNLYDKVSNIILCGLGDVEELTEQKILELGGNLLTFCEKNSLSSVSICRGNNFVLNGNISNELFTHNIILGMEIKSYRMDKYLSEEKQKQKLKNAKILESLEVYIADKVLQDAILNRNEIRGAILSGINLTKNLANAPGNEIYPESYANLCKSELESLGVKVTILDEKDMEKMGMGSILAVGQGSTKPPRMVIFEWNGNPGSNDKYSFVGKGVTFDTGGISIKPAKNMDEMKYDMSGSATVVGLIKTLAIRKAKVNVIGGIGLAENMPDGNAVKPGDVVTSMSGQTIEVLNTDAEGRMVLADTLHYVVSTYNPKFVIDLATLTGAIVVALGHEYAGMFSNDEDLIEKLKHVGQDTGEKVWHMPIGDSYDKQIDSSIADMKNTGSGYGGGSITAAQFLKRFVGNTSWVHLDIAGVEMFNKNSSLVAHGATGFGVRLLNKLVEDYYEDK